MLEKILESPLDCEEIQPVHSNGDQPWVFFGRNKRLLISWLQSPSAVILEPIKIKSANVFRSINGIGCHDLRFLNVEL